MSKKVAYKHWSKSEDELLTKMVLDGKTATQISTVLSRTKASIAARKYTLNIEQRTKRSDFGQSHGTSPDVTFAKTVESFVPETSFKIDFEQLSEIAKSKGINVAVVVFHH